MGTTMNHDEPTLDYTAKAEPKLRVLTPEEYPTWEQALDWAYDQGETHGMKVAMATETPPKHWMNSSTIMAALKILGAQLPVALAYAATLFIDGDFVGWGVALTSAMTIWQVPNVMKGRIKAGGIL